MKLSQISESQLKSLSVLQKTAIVYGEIEQSNERADVAILLGCDPKRSKKRAIACAELYKKGLVKYIISSGAPINEVDGENLSEAEYMKRVLIENGVSPEIIFKDEHALTTVENFLGSAMVWHRNISFYKTNSVYIVSAMCHMRRAMLLAKAFLPKYLKLYCRGAVDEKDNAQNWHKFSETTESVDWEIRCLKKLITTGIIEDIEFNSF